MSKNREDLSRRAFITGVAGAAMGAAIPNAISASEKSGAKNLLAWSCGGLAEAFIPANKRYKEKTGTEIAYTGAFAAALGKSLLGSATTEVFAGRVLKLAKKLRKEGKMLWFKPLCFTRYVMVAPKGNPGGISGIKDMAGAKTRVILAPEASAPGGKAVAGILKKAGILKEAMKNSVIQGSCVQRTMEDLINGKGEVSIVEYRITRMPIFKGKAEIIPIPEKYFPKSPLTFTIGVMKHVKNEALADHYVNFILSEEGQDFFESAGFIPAISDKGRKMTEEFGVKDV